jgi:hypothetical protein
MIRLIRVILVFFGMVLLVRRIIMRKNVASEEMAEWLELGSRTMEKTGGYKDFSETARYAGLGAIIKLKDGTVGEIAREYRCTGKHWGFEPEDGGTPFLIDENDVLGTFYSRIHGEWIGLEGNRLRLKMLVRNFEEWIKIADKGLEIAAREVAVREVKTYEKLIKEVEENIKQILEEDTLHKLHQGCSGKEKKRKP